MSKIGKGIPFFTDQNVSDAVGNNLVREGHELTRLREVVDTKTADATISKACSERGQGLITHDKDFKGLAKRLNITKRQYRNSLHRIQSCCAEPESARRIVDALSSIESEWRLANADRPMVIEISSGAIKTFR